MLTTFPKALSLGYFLSRNFPNEQFPNQLLNKSVLWCSAPYSIAAAFSTDLWKVATWEIVHLGSCPCENGFEEIPYTLRRSTTYSSTMYGCKI